MIVSCRITHRDGHSADTPSPPFPVGSNAGASEIQKAASAHTYARRYSMIAALGLWDVDKDFDDDGRGDTPPETITEQQALQLEDLLNEIHDHKLAAAKRAKLLEYIEGKALADCPVSKFTRAVENLQQTLHAQAKP